ncbi:MAG: ribonuclease J [Actinomycetes bacterium]
MSDKVRVLPLGGVGEIGKNMAVVEYDGRLLILDAGLRFPGGDLPGIDLILPDFEYIKERSDAIEAVVLTHGHEDHIGALPWLLRGIGVESVPIVVSGPLTIEMAKSKLKEHRLDDSALMTVDAGEILEAGPFTIEMIHLTHSIPDARAVAVGTPAGTVLFTGDYKFDQTPVAGEPADMARLAELGAEGVLLLCGDSTNADRPGFSPSESLVGPALVEVFERCEGRIIVTSFASNVHRVQQVVDAAEVTGRKIALVGRSMVKNSKIAKTLGHIDIPAGMLIQPREINDFKDEDVVVVSTGSQGEPLSALRRMAHHDHQQIELHSGDTIVFSATPVPGNERAVNETVDRLFQIGCTVITADDAPIHASGHGYAEELKLMLNLTRPRYFMPVHGDAKRLRLHRELAEQVGIAPDNIFESANGLPLDIDGSGARFGPEEHSGVLLVDGMEFGEPSDAAVRDRRTIADDGVIVVVVAVSAQSGELVSEPEVVLRGIAIGAESDLVVKAVREAAADACARAAETRERDREDLERRVHDAVAEKISKARRSRPLVVPVVIEA